MLCLNRVNKVNAEESTGSDGYCILQTSTDSGTGRKLPSGGNGRTTTGMLMKISFKIKLYLSSVLRCIVCLIQSFKVILS